MTNGPPASDERQAQLVAAARLVRSWAVAQRATWSGAPLAWPPTEAATVPDADVDAEVALGTVDAPAVSASVEEPVAPTEPANHAAPARPSLFVRPTAAVVVRFPLASIARWSVRVLSVAACLVIVAVGGAKGWALWTAWKNAPVIGTAILQSDPPGAIITVDGVALGDAPLTKQLPPGRHVVQFQRRKETRTLEVDVVKGQSTVARVDWNQAQTGRLEVRSDPSGAHVKIDGRGRGVTPLILDAIPIGSHLVVIESDRGSVRKNVTVETSGTALVSEGIYSGWIRVASPIELEVREGTLNLRLDERRVALVSAGPHDLRLENPAVGFSETRHLEVIPGATTDVVVNPPPSSLTVTATGPAEVLIDGERAGETPLINFPVSLGRRDVTVTSPTGAQRHISVTITTSPARVDVDFAKP